MPSLFINNVSGKTGHFYYLGNGRDILFSGRRDTLFSGKRDILYSGNNFILWESGHLSSGKYPLGIGNFGDEVQPDTFKRRLL